MQVAAQFDETCSAIEAKKNACPICGGRDTDPIPAENPRMAEWVECEYCKQCMHAVCTNISHDTLLQIEGGTNKDPIYCSKCNSL
jgi:hypothetical protein